MNDEAHRQKDRADSWKQAFFMLLGQVVLTYAATQGWLGWLG